MDLKAQYQRYILETEQSRKQKIQDYMTHLSKTFKLDIIGENEFGHDISKTGEHLVWFNGGKDLYSICKCKNPSKMCGY